MSKVLRFIEIGDSDPYEFRSLRESLVSNVDSGVSPSTAVLLQITRKHIYLGRMANIKKMVDADYCKDNDILIIRATESSASSLIHSNVIKFYLILDETSHLLSGNIKSIEARFAKAIVDTMKSLGLQVEHPPRSNNLIIDGKKMGGLFFHWLGRMSKTLQVTVTLTLQFNHDEAEKAITSPKDMREWVSPITSILGRVLSLDEVRDAILEVYPETLDVVFESDVLSPEEEQESENILRKYKSENWLNTGRWSHVKDYGRLTDAS